MRRLAFRSGQHFTTGRTSSIRKAILTCAIALLAALNLPAQFPTQKPAGYVNDLAGVLSPAARQQLEDLCAELDQKTKAQLAIVTVRSLEGRALEEFTIDLATKWGIGPKGSDRGIMLFLAIQDRRSRIEVGYGLEPILPDGRAGAILRSMTPYLRNNDYDGAMRLGATAIAQIVAQEAKVSLSAQPAPTPRVPTIPQSERTWRWLENFWWLFLIVAFILWRVTLSLTVLGMAYAIIISITGLWAQILTALAAIGLSAALLVPPFYRRRSRRDRSKAWWSDFVGWSGGGSGNGGGREKGGKRRAGVRQIGAKAVRICAQRPVIEIMMA